MALRTIPSGENALGHLKPAHLASVMKPLFIALGILFAGFAVVQMNDPDPLRWVVAYGVVAALCFAVAFERCPAWLAGLVCFGIVAAAIYFIPALGQVRDGSLSMQHPDSISDEEVREASGLLLAAVASIAAFIRAHRSTSGPRREGLRPVEKT